ncbi:ROK family protein [Propioniciclava sp. MC1683]|uniref:ROK family transcriptional regulator n=1 Tax=Propioniciclava sp. MC1683 TaxID=2760309 RepID=UPI00160128FB|nr:ROK family transcriptional regulator [Propioniciclava sp. MC1683]MBB1501679.1 ROK family protein [Propioniciclava sp. MC1683]
MRQPSSADPSSVRQWNERAVITALRDAGTVRVAQVAEQVGLSTASTREVLRGLVTKHWVVPEAQSSGSVGRPASMFRLATPPVGLLGLDVGGHRVRGVLDAGSGSVVVLGEVSIEQGVPGVEATRAALVELLAPVDVSGVWMTGLAVSGALDHSDRLDRSIAMADFVGRRPAEVLGSVLPGAVMTLHDTKAALWAERVEGAALGRRDVLYVHLGRRPSLALLLAGQLYRGAHGSAGELSLNELLPASGGYDWVEAGGDADAQGRALVAAVAGDPVAVAGAQRFVLDIVPQVAFAAGLVDPELLVLGGALGPVIRPVLDEVRDELDRRLQTPPDVAVGELDEYVTARGAVHLARERLWKTLLDSEGPLPPLERAALLA